jgi:SAM-dependent methyltransferase
MSQAAPKLPLTGAIDVRASTQSQQRGAHGAFRYFGKLAPDVTGAVLDVAAELTEIRYPVIDLMCGSGTTLIEAAERGWPSIGVEVNPVAKLYALVKSRPLNAKRFQRYLDAVLTSPAASTSDVDLIFAQTRNASRWFSSEARAAIARLRMSISALPRSSEADALLAALLSRLRRVSNASERTGRLFFDPGSARPVLPEFEAAAARLLTVAPKKQADVAVILGDARSTVLPEDACDLCFCHPPYFALYRYSADVLRFEMEIAGFDRRATNRLEIREGWKSGDVSNLDGYIEDMGAVFTEARRLTRPDGVFVLVASNSTLGDVQLPVIDRLASKLQQCGWRVAEHLKRSAHFGAAKYHRSTRPDKIIQQDHVLICSR